MPLANIVPSSHRGRIRLLVFTLASQKRRQDFQEVLENHPHLYSMSRIGKFTGSGLRVGEGDATRLLFHVSTHQLVAQRIDTSSWMSSQENFCPQRIAGKSICPPKSTTYGVLAQGMRLTLTFCYQKPYRSPPHLSRCTTVMIPIARRATPARL